MVFEISFPNLLKSIGDSPNRRLIEKLSCLSSLMVNEEIFNGFVTSIRSLSLTKPLSRAIAALNIFNVDPNS